VRFPEACLITGILPATAAQGADAATEPRPAFYPLREVQEREENGDCDNSKNDTRPEPEVSTKRHGRVTNDGRAWADTLSAATRGSLIAKQGRTQAGAVRY
jgi:hypothetical protein